MCYSRMGKGGFATGDGVRFTFATTGVGILPYWESPLKTVILLYTAQSSFS